MARLIPLIGAAVVALLVGAGAGWFFGQATAPKTVIVAEEKPTYVEYTIKDRIVNLADQGGRRYLKVTMVLQAALLKGGAHAGGSEGLVFTVAPDSGLVVEAAGGGGAGAGAEPVLPNAAHVHDAVTNVLSAKRSEEIMTAEGRDRLREELKNKINAVLPKEVQVVKVFFVDFIIQ